ncbi:MAG: hypothetical protein M3494_15555 [Actinomycetota bacterium]|nr:hypothetical protein [Actinomycetota bacterium]
MAEPNSGADASADARGGMPLYGLFGVTLASGFPFKSNLPEASGEPDVVFEVSGAAPVEDGGLELVYAAEPYFEDGRSLTYVYRGEGCHLLRFTEVADYYLWDDRIVCHLLEAKYEYIVEIYLLGHAFSLWLELRGMPALHAAAVVSGGGAAVFLATNEGGKSSLATSLMLAGCPLLTDDILPIEERDGEGIVARPGYPSMRMWPEQAGHFLGEWEDLEIVHPWYSKRRVPVGDGFGEFHGRAAPVSRFYLPERRDPGKWGEGVEISDVPPGEALMALLSESFIPQTAEALGFQRRRMEILASLVRGTPVRRVSYPEGYDRLPKVRDRILEDLEEDG